MSLEAAVVVGSYGKPLYWHLPSNRSFAYLPDSRMLWEVIWQHRDDILGIAHSHPGFGFPRPSQEDRTTFSACELALNRRLDWWIMTQDCVSLYRWEGPERYDYQPLGYINYQHIHPWYKTLHFHSYGE